MDFVNLDYQNLKSGVTIINKLSSYVFKVKYEPCRMCRPSLIGCYSISNSYSSVYNTIYYLHFAKHIECQNVSREPLIVVKNRWFMSFNNSFSVADIIALASLLCVVGGGIFALHQWKKNSKIRVFFTLNRLKMTKNPLKRANFVQVLCKIDMFSKKLYIHLQYSFSLIYTFYTITTKHHYNEKDPIGDPFCVYGLLFSRSKRQCERHKEEGW